MKNINIKIKGLNLKISVRQKGINGKRIKWFNETFVTLKDLRVFLNNFIENEYLTTLNE